MDPATIDPALADVVPCGIIVFSENGSISHVNKYLAELLHYEKHQLAGCPVEKIFTVATKIFYQTHFFPLLRLNEKAEEIFMSLNTSTGSAVPVIATAKKSGDAIYCVFVTVWQRKKYEDEILEAKRTAEQVVAKNETLNALKHQAEIQLAESERQLSLLKQFNQEYVELNKIISHDLHEPIRKLMVHIDILLSGGYTDISKLHTHLRKMLQLGDRLRQLTICLQQYVEIDTSREELTQVDLNEIVQTSFTMAARENGNEDAVLQSDDLPVIEGYRSQLERLFSELMSNCFKFRNTTTQLHISINKTEFRNNIYKEIKDKYRYIDFLRIHIEDNGPGFPDEHKQYIFGLFNKLNSEEEGKGLGLALCKKIAERHNGSISASSSPGKTVFSVSLPLQQKDHFLAV